MPWLLAIVATVTPPARSAGNAVAGARNRYCLAAGVPRSVTAVSMLTTARSAPASSGWIGASAVAGSASRGRTTPSKCTSPPKWLAGRSFGVNWPEVDYLRDPAWVRTRTLVLHGDEDTLVPVADSQRLAAVRPELVTLLRFPVAGHVESWNADRSRYQQAVRGFLATVAR